MNTDLCRLRRALKSEWRGLDDALWMLRALPEVSEQVERFALACAGRAIVDTEQSTKDLLALAHEVRKLQIGVDELTQTLRLSVLDHNKTLATLTRRELFERAHVTLAEKAVFSACDTVRFDDFYRKGVSAKSAAGFSVSSSIRKARKLNREVGLGWVAGQQAEEAERAWQVLQFRAMLLGEI